jgi:hypothetical protein
VTLIIIRADEEETACNRLLLQGAAERLFKPLRETDLIEALVLRLQSATPR